MGLVPSKAFRRHSAGPSVRGQADVPLGLPVLRPRTSRSVVSERGPKRGRNRPSAVSMRGADSVDRAARARSTGVRTVAEPPDLLRDSAVRHEPGDLGSVCPETRSPSSLSPTAGQAPQRDTKEGLGCPRCKVAPRGVLGARIFPRAPVGGAYLLWPRPSRITEALACAHIVEQLLPAGTTAADARAGTAWRCFSIRAHRRRYRGGRDPRGGQSEAG